MGGGKAMQHKTYDKLRKMPGAVQTGGRGSVRRKKKAMRRHTTYDERLQQSTAIKAVQGNGSSASHRLADVAAAVAVAAAAAASDSDEDIVEMYKETLSKMVGAVRIGGKGSVRRKKKAAHRTTYDKKKVKAWKPTPGFIPLCNDEVEEVTAYSHLEGETSDDDDVVAFRKKRDDDVVVVEPAEDEVGLTKTERWMRQVLRDWYIDKDLY